MGLVFRNTWWQQQRSDGSDDKKSLLKEEETASRTKATTALTSRNKEFLRRIGFTVAKIWGRTY